MEIEKTQRMFHATSYGENTAGLGLSHQADTAPTSTVSTVANITSLSGRLIHGGSGTDALATFYNAGGVTITTPSLTFTKPASLADTVKQGTCSFLVQNLPVGRPSFDLEMTFLRPVAGSTQKTMNVKLSVLKWNNNVAALHEYTGTVEVPAAYPVATTQLVTWTPIPSADGYGNELPMFFEPEDSYSMPGTQAVHLTLSTDDTMDEKVHILDFRFTFY